MICLLVGLCASDLCYLFVTWLVLDCFGLWFLVFCYCAGCSLIVVLLF